MQSNGTITNFQIIMEAGRMDEEEIQSKSFFGKTKVAILNFFKSTKDYRFKTHMPFLSTREGIDNILYEIERLETTGYFSSHETLEQLIQRATHERDLVENRHENLGNRARIYFSLAAIMTTIVAIGIINGNILINRIQDHLNSDMADRVITLASLGILLYLIVMSISTLSLVLRNYSSGFWNKHTKISPGGFDLVKESGRSGTYTIKIQQYITAKTIDYSVESTVRADTYWRNLLGDSTERLVRAVILVVSFSLYLAIPDPYVQIGYGIILSIFFISTLIRDRIDVVYLIIALYKPEKNIKREIEIE